MRSITKGIEPASLAEHRQTPHGTYDNFQDKDLLRKVLATEQGQLCCYCMGRIHAHGDSMKIEHWHCQADHPDEQLNYKNLLGACRGGEGQPGNRQHCDTRKGDKNLMWNPAEPSHQIESRIRYELDGSIHGQEPEFDGQLNEVLNLNLPWLMQGRKSLLDAVLGWWKHERARLRGPVPSHRLVQKRNQHVTGSGQLAPYCQVAVWWLNQRIEGMAT